MLVFLYILIQKVQSNYCLKDCESNTNYSMSVFLQISDFQAQQSPKDLDKVVRNLIFMRKHKQMMIQKPAIDTTTSDKAWNDPYKAKNSANYFKTQEQEMEENSKNNAVLLQKTYKDNDIFQSQQLKNGQLNLQLSPGKTNKQHHKSISYKILKRKLIEKAISQTVDKEREKSLQKRYCKYLVNSLHKSNLLLIHRNIPPNLSVLQTIDDGDYLQVGQRKEFPHYSNVIQPIHLPPVNASLTIIKQPVRFQPRQHVFSVQENTVFKVKKLYLLIQKLFEQSIRTCEIIREMNFNGNHSLKMDNQNHDFQKIGRIIGMNSMACKLLYDMMNDHYDIEKELALGKSDDSKVKTCKQVMDLAQNQVKKYFSSKLSSQQSTCRSKYIPLQEFYLSLKDLRDIFFEVYENK